VSGHRLLYTLLPWLAWLAAWPLWPLSALVRRVRPQPALLTGRGKRLSEQMGCR
jgi:hypothetical protein